MTQKTIEQRLPELTCAYVAKGLAPHLELNAYVPPRTRRKEKLFTDYLTDALFFGLYALNGFKPIDRSEEDKQAIRELNKIRDEEDARFYMENDLVTKEEREAFTITHFAGLCLGRQADYWNEKNIQGLTQSSFDKCLEIAIEDGIHCVREHGYEVNSDFAFLAKNYLSTETQKRVKDGLEFCLLDNVKIRQEDNLLMMKRYFRKEGLE